MTEVEIVRERPPALWLRPCTDYLPPDIRTDTTGDLARAIPPLVAALQQCDEDKTALRNWADTPN